MSLPRNNRENKPKKGGICVANHTSPIDIVILCNDGCYAMVQLLLLDVSTHLCQFQSGIIISMIASMCLSGGSGSWRFDGSPPESHGEVLSSRLVWESRDERSPPGDQKVSSPLQHVLSGLSLHFFSRLYFLSVAALALREVGIFLAVKSSRVSAFVLSKQEQICFGELLLNSDSCSLDSSTSYNNITSSPQTLVPDVWCIVQMWKKKKKLFKGLICRYLCS